MVKITQSVSNKFANLGLLCALIVVQIHLPKPGFSAGNYSAVHFLYSVFPGCLNCMANAFFFLAAGFFLAGHVEEKGWWSREMSKRVKSLLIPFVVINLFWFGVIAIYRHEFSLQGLMSAMGLTYANPAVGPLWFVRTLFLLVATLPLFLPVLRSGRSAAYCFCAIVIALNGVAGYLGVDIGALQVYNLHAMGYFLLGASLRLYGLPCLDKRCGMILFVLGMLASETAIIIGGSPDDASPTVVFHFLLTICVPLLIAGAWTLVSANSWSKRLTSFAFPIYLIHGMLVHASYIVVGKLGFHDALFGNVCGYVGMFCLYVLVSCGVAALIRHSSFFSKVLLGGR